MVICAKQVIDWYDGLVTGVITRTPSEELWLVTLIAWSPVRSLRAYGAVKITTNEFETLGADTTWPRVIDAAKAIAFGKEDAVLMLIDGANEVIFERDLPISELRSHATFDISETLDPKLEHYLTPGGA